MPVNQTTTGRGYPLPYPSNLLADDVQRIRDAFQAIDNDMAARPTNATVQGLVDAAAAALVDGSPAALNTLNELAAALGDDANFATTVTTALANRYTKAESDARYVQGAVQTEMVFTAATSQTAFTLSTPVINKASALVTVDGIIQPTAEYSLSQDGVTLTLSEGVPVGTIVRVLALGVASAGAPADDTITTPKLRDGAVTNAKLDLAGIRAIGSLADGATITPNFALGSNWSVVLGGNRTLANPTNLMAGQSGVIYLVQDGSGSRTVAFGNAWDFAGGVAPTLSTAAGAVDCLVYAVRTTGAITANLLKDVK